jgi:hypothetical protein
MKAWELLSDKSKWTKSTFARDSKGESVQAWGEDAVCWCTLGAIQRCYRQSREGLSKAREVAGRLEQAASVQHFGGIIAHWNDAATYEEVVALLKELDI